MLTVLLTVCLHQYRAHKLRIESDAINQRYLLDEMVDPDLPDGSSGHAHEKQRNRVIFLFLERGGTGRETGNGKREKDEVVGGDACEKGQSSWATGSARYYSTVLLTPL